MWCDYCRVYAGEGETDLSGVFTQLGDRLRTTLSRIERRLSGEPERFGGGGYSPDFQARSGLPPPRVTVTTPPRGESYQSTEIVDEKVFKYIEAHNGEISISQAAQDLGIPVGQLQAAIGRLRSAGHLDLQPEELNPRGPISPPRRKLCVNCSRPIEAEARYCSGCGSEQPPSSYS